jgi:hypothetical protein
MRKTMLNNSHERAAESARSSINGACLGDFSSGANLGGTVSHYRNKQNVFTQGTPAHTLFYIQEKETDWFCPYWDRQTNCCLVNLFC